MEIDSGIFRMRWLSVANAEKESEKDEIKLERSVNMVYLKRWKNFASTKSGAAVEQKARAIECKFHNQ